MKIAIDARTWSWTGIGRYTRNLLLSLLALPARHEFVVALSEGDKENFEQLFPVLPSHVHLEFVSGSYYSLAEQTGLVWQLAAIEADLWHFTHFNVPLLFRRPYVVTIHDITRFLFPGQVRSSLYQQVAYEFVFKKAVERARAVISVSEATRRDMQQLPLTLPDRVTTIYEGIESVFSQLPLTEARREVRSLLGFSEGYLLFVGVWMNHKNVRRLFEAFSMVRRQYPNVRLVVTGKQAPGYVDCRMLAAESGVASHVVFPGFVPHELLLALYSEATMLVFPSLYEGVGLPPLEAAACGTPVVASGVSSIPEFMGDAAEYVNPESSEDIARGIMRVLGSPLRREELIQAGKKRVRRYTWEKAADEHIALYESCMVG